MCHKSSTDESYFVFYFPLQLFFLVKITQGLLFQGFHTLASNSARCLAYLPASLSQLSRIFKVLLVFKLSHLKRLKAKVIFPHWKNHETSLHFHANIALIQGHLEIVFRDKNSTYVQPQTLYICGVVAKHRQTGRAVNHSFFFLVVVVVILHYFVR